MNKVYRIVWSKTRRAWVVASELATGHGKSGSGKRQRVAPARQHLFSGVSLAALMAAMSLPALAASYNVADEAALRQAIIDANADGDASSTITLTGNIQITDPTVFQTIAKALTIDTNGWSLSAPASASNSPGFGASFLGGPLVLSGQVGGGASGSAPGSATQGSAGGAGVTLSNGALENRASVTGGTGTNRTSYVANVFAGAGGTGLALTNATLINDAAGSITGGTGGWVDHGVVNGSVGSTGGVGGAGVALTNGSLDNRGTITGGTGGAIIATGNDNQWGGDGGVGAVLTGGAAHVNSGTLAGGVGGIGSNVGGGSGSGAGGAGLSLSGGSLLNASAGLISGGNGRVDAVNGRGSSGGQGATVANGTLENQGTLIGGNGAGNGGGASGLAGVGVTGTGGAHIINSGAISAGLNWAGTRGNAVQFTGGNNRLELRQGSAITGNVVGTATDTLALGGAANANFDVSQISAAAQYRGFGRYEKTGTGTWTLTGTTAAVTPWTLKEGTLSTAADNVFGAASGALTFDGGTLQVTGTAYTGTARAINWGANGGGFDIADASNTFIVSQSLASGGGLTKRGAGTLVLTGSNGYTGGTTIAAGYLQIGNGGATGSITGNVVNNGWLVFNRANDWTYAGAISGSGHVFHNGAGTTTLTGIHGYTGVTRVNGGELVLASGGQITHTDGLSAGSASGESGTMTVTGAGSQLRQSSSSLQTSHLGNGGTGTLNIFDGGRVELRDLSLGAGATGRGTVNVSGDNSTLVTGPVNMRIGTHGIGILTITDGGRVRHDQSAQIGIFAGSGAVTVSGGSTWDIGVNLDMRRGTVTVLDGGIVKANAVVQGASPPSSDVKVLVSGPGSWLESATTFILANNAVATGALTLTDGGVAKVGGGTLVFGPGAAALNIGGASGSAATRAGVLDAAAITSGGNDSINFNHTESAYAFGAAIAGAGAINQVSGITSLTGNSAAFNGATNVTGGTLRVNGTLGSATSTVNVSSGGVLGGAGVIGGDVFVTNGTIAAGNSPGTLTINGDLNLDAASVLDFELGEAGVAGGALNDLINVGGDLVLDGTLNVSESAGGTYGAGVYRLINYTGNLTDNGLDLGFMPAGNTQFVQTSIAHQVNLVNTSGLTLNYWDGDAGVQHDGAITGGNGTWRASGDEKWTDANGSVNAPYASGAFAIFAGTGGTVSADDGQGAISVSGMQFAVDGYRVQGDAIALGAGTNTLRVGDGSAAGGAMTATMAAELAGSGRLDKTDLGTLVLTGANSYGGGTAISGGTLQLGDGGASGSIVGDVVNNAALAFNRSDAFTFGNVISGSGAVNQRGASTTVFTGANTYTGGTTISAGTLQIGDGGTTGSIHGDVLNNATLAFNRNDALTFNGVINGYGAIDQRGTGTTILTGNSNGFAGNTSVTSGTLRVDGTLGSAASTATVQNGAMLTGNGTLGGAVTVNSGGRLAPGNGVGQLSTGSLTLNSGALLDFELGAKQVVGGALNDLLVVNGDLNLDGALHIAQAPGGAFEIGVYRVIDYTGGLTDNQLDIGATPAGIAPNHLFVQTAVANQVNLINTGGLTFRFWDGPSGHDNGLFDGGTGTWLASGNSNWTAMNPTANAPWTDAAFSVFQGSAGNVVVDNSDGAVNFAGMQFLVGGYTLSGGTLTADRADTMIRVGDGTAAGGAMTATIDATIAGSGVLRKTDIGTLILGGDNSYTGGTTVAGGVLQVARDANLGAASGALAFDGGVLRTSGDFTSARSVNFLAGGGAVDTQEHDVRLTGALSGDGDWTKHGAGTLQLAGANTATGMATVAAGMLQAGSAGAFGAASYTIEAGAALDLNGFSQAVYALTNAGTVSVLGTTLTVSGGYTGNNGVLQLGTALGDDSSASDRLIVDGGTASGRTQIELTNLGGLGAQTAGNGIELISAVNGATTTAQGSRDAFTLAGGHIEAGAFEYRLHAGDANGAGENWYLRSTLPDDTTTQPEVVTYRAEVPLYAAAPALLAQGDQTMLGTLHGREGDINGSAAESDGQSYRVWARGITQSLDSRQQGAVSPRNDARAHGSQVGIDLLQGSAHRLGLYGGQLDWDSDVNGFASGVDSRFVGQLSGRSNYLGAYWTYRAVAGWYSDVVLQQGWHDGDVKTGARGDVEGESTLASVELGKAFSMSTHWQLEPQAQLIVNQQRLETQSIPSARFSYDDELITTLRLGARLVGDFATERDRVLPYARVNLWHGVNGTDTLAVAGPGAGTDIRSARGYTSAEVAVGATWAWNRRFALYGEAGRWIALDDSRGQELKSSHSASLGLRVNW